MIPYLHENILVADPTVLDVGEHVIRFGKTDDGSIVTVTGSYDNVNFEAVVSLDSAADVYKAVTGKHRYYKLDGDAGVTVTLVGFDPRAVA